MRISVIIPTYNGAHKIGAALRAIKEQTCQPDETIVVVDGSTDNTLEVISGFKSTFPAFRIIVQDNAGRSSVRNRGAREANGDLLIFFDDDMRPLPDCIACHLAHHQEKPGSIMTGAAIDSCLDTDVQRFKSSLNFNWTSSLKKNQGNPINTDSLFLMAANFSISKTLFWQLDGFDARLKDAEDFDLAVRAHAASITLYYNHKAFAYHEDPITGRSYIKRLRQYQTAHKLLRQLEPARYASIQIHDPKVPSGCKGVIFRFFSHRTWVLWLDRGQFKWLLPRWLRYRLYDWIITANGSFYPERVKL